MFSEIINAIIIKLFNSNFCHYINGPETLPPPLTKEEEQRVLQAITDGDESARDELITHNLRLVVYIAKKFDSPSASTEDLVSIGTIGLMKAVKTFAPEKNIKLATYASRCIENEILMYFRAQKKTAGDVSLSECIETGKDANALSLMDVICADEDLFENLSTKEMNRQLYDAMARALTPRERTILILRYGLGGRDALTQREIAAKCGISRSYVSRIEKKALKSLQEALNG